MDVGVYSWVVMDVGVYSWDKVGGDGCRGVHVQLGGDGCRGVQLGQGRW